MSLPSPLLTVPSLLPDQASFQGLTLGAGTPYQWTKIEGLAKPKVRSGNTNRPRARGAFVGTNLLGTRLVTFTLDIGPPFGSYNALSGALSALQTACSTEGTTEQPLWLQLPNLPLLCGMARVLEYDANWDVTADLGQMVQGAVIQFEATDPYLYSAPTLAPSVGLPGPSGGFGFPFAFPLSFGGSATPNQVTVTNSGDVPCWPTLVITGPCLNPSVANQSIAGNPTIQFGIQLNTGDRLVVDCDMGSIVYFASGATVGAPEPGILMSGSTFFSLPPGNSILAFNSQDTSQVAGSLAVWNASAYDGLL